MTYDPLVCQRRRKPNDQTLGSIFHNSNTLLSVLDLMQEITQSLDVLRDMMQPKSKLV